jgi:hypothetical protein
MTGFAPRVAEAGLPACFWPFAIQHVVYVRNRVCHMLHPTYIKSMLGRYGMQDSLPASTRMLESFFAHLEAE